MRYANVFGPRQDPKSEAGRGVHLRVPAAGQAAAHRLRRRAPDPRLRLREGCGPGQRAGQHGRAATGRRPRRARVQHRHRRPSATCSSWPQSIGEVMNSQAGAGVRPAPRRASCSAARSTSAKPSRCSAGRPQVRFEDGLVRARRLVQEGGRDDPPGRRRGAPDADRAGALRQPRDQDRPRHHRRLLPGLLVHHRPQVVAVPPAQPPGGPLLRRDGADHPAAGRLPRGDEAAALALQPAVPRGDHLL